jgi:hypothetical protein
MLGLCPSATSSLSVKSATTLHTSGLEGRRAGCALTFSRYPVYGNTTMGARQKATFWAPGSRTVTWQS